MTERRQFCPRGHDTFEVGRDSSYRCRECKRLAGQAARDARDVERWELERADQKAHDEELRRGVEAWERRIARYKKAQEKKAEEKAAREKKTARNVPR